MEPEKQQQFLEELAKQDADRMKEALLEGLDQGWLLFARGKPRERLAAYRAQTMDADVPLVVDPDYLDKLQRGEVPMLLAVQLMQAKLQGGAQAQPDPPPFWPTIMTLPGYIFAAIARDFRDLLNDEARRERTRNAA